MKNIFIVYEKFLKCSKFLPWCWCVVFISSERRNAYKVERDKRDEGKVIAY